MPKKTPRPRKLPKLTKKQKDSLLLYKRLTDELGHGPMLREFGEEAGYSEGSETAGAQRMINRLEAMGLVAKPELQPVGGGVTALGLEVLRSLSDDE